MERAMLWFKCAALHDPVRPVIKQPAVIGWEAKHRQVDLVIARSFRGDELLARMKGWVTADVHQVTDLIRQFGSFKILDDYDLVVETRTQADMEALANQLAEACGAEVWLEPMPKTRLV
jgi:hypothetical protein